MAETNKTYIKVVGKSMLPTLKPGEVYLVKAKKTYKVNDLCVIVVTERKEPKTVIKRLVKIENGNYFFESDNMDKLNGVSQNYVVTKDCICGTIKV